MENKNPVKFLVPVVNSNLSEKELLTVYQQLDKQNVISLPEDSPCDKLQVTASLLEAVNTSKRVSFPWIKFGDIIQSIGKETLHHVILKFNQSNRHIYFNWMIKHWDQLLSSPCALNNLNYYIKGLPVDRNPGAAEWLEIIHLISQTDEQKIRYFICQLKLNLVFGSEKKDEEALKQCFAYLFKDIFEKFVSADSREKIASVLLKEEVVKIDNWLNFNKKKSTKTFLKYILPQFTPEFLKVFVDAIKKEEMILLSEVVELFCMRNCENLIWILSFWKSLSDIAVPIANIASDCCFCSQKEIEEKENTWLLYLARQVALENNQNAESFMKQLKNKYDLFNMVLKQQNQSSTIAAKSTQNKEIGSHVYVEKMDCQESNSSLQDESKTFTENPRNTVKVASSHTSNQSVENSGDQKSTYADITKTNTSSNYNLRSKASGQETLTSFMGDNLENMFGYDYSFKKSVSVEFRLIVDENFRLPETGKMHILFVDFNSYVPMDYNQERNFFFYFVKFFFENGLVYKYFWLDSNGNKLWELLPCKRYGFVNRKIADITSPENYGLLINFDVAAFSKTDFISRSDFRSIYSRNVFSHLPPVQMIEFPEGEAAFKSWLDYLREIEMWWNHANKEVDFDKNDSFPILPTCRTEMEKYIIEITKFQESHSSAQRCQRILACLALLLFANKNKLFPDIKNEKVLNGFCSGLFLDGVNEVDIHLLRHYAENCCRTELVEAIVKFKEVLSDSFSSFKLLPLLYVLLYDERCIYVDKVWNEAVNKLHIKKQDVSKAQHSSVVELASSVIDLTKTFPHLFKEFQSILPLPFILNQLNKDERFAKSLYPEKFLTLVLKQKINENFAKYFGSEQFFSFIISFLKDFELQCESGNENEAAQELEKALETFMRKYNISFFSSNFTAVNNFFEIALKLMSCFCLFSKDSSFSKGKHVELFNSLLKGFQSTFGSVYRKIDEKQFEIWNLFLTAKFIDKNLNDEWISTIKELLQDFLLKKLDEISSNVLEVFENNLDDWKACAELQACISEAVFRFAMSLKHKDENSHFVTRMLRFGESQFKKIGKILNRMFTETWSAKKNSTDKFFGVVEFVTTWPFAAKFLDLVGKSQQKKFVTSDIEKDIKFILKQLGKVEEDIISGSIKTKHLKQILKSYSSFKDVLCFSSKNLEVVSKVLEKRAEELKQFENLKCYLEYFVRLCTHSKNSRFDLTLLNHLLERDLNDIPWSDIIELKQDCKADTYVKLFMLSTEVLSAVHEIASFKVGDNEFMKHFWDEQSEVFCQNKTFDLAGQCSTSCVIGDDTNADDRDGRSGGDNTDADERDQSSSGDEIDQGSGDDDTGDAGEDNDDVAIFLNETNSSDNGKSEPSNCLIEVNSLPLFWRKVKMSIHSITQQIIEGVLSLHDVEAFFQKFARKETAIKDILSLLRDLHSFLINTRIDESDVDQSSNEIDFESGGFDEESDSVASEEIEETNEEDLSDAEVPYLTTNSTTREVDQFSVSEEQNDGVAVDQTKLKDLDDNIDNILPLRADQICNFLSLKHKQNIASVFDDLKNCLKLKGNFTYLEIMQKQQSLTQENSLDCITKSLMKASETIEKIKEEKIEFLNDFMNQKDLVDWLRESMKDRSEVKVMSDLAMISAGENAIEVDRVSCFLSSVMSFAPFIFDLPAEAGLDETLAAFNKFSEVNKDVYSKLKKQWDATAQHLEWLKGIKDFHGSVEKSSLACAQDINCRGTYTIGNEDAKIATPENALTLNVKSQDSKVERIMSLSDLHNLESRLMLIAGEAEKGLDDVKIFIENLSLVESLEQVYVKLKSAGCLLFNNWTANVSCVVATDDAESSTSFFDIYFDRDSPSIHCENGVKEEIKKIIAVLEGAYQRWNESLIEKRQQFYHLNYFNIQQVMYLCKELAKVNEYSDIPHQVYTLLEFVKSDVDKDEIVTLLREATKLPESEDDENEEIEQDISSKPKSEQKRKMTKQLIDVDVSEHLAKAAVQAIADENGFPLDYDACYIKALELETEEYDENNETTDLVAKFDEEAGFDASSSQINVIHSVVTDRSPMTLQGVINDILEYQAKEDVGASVAVKTICERYLKQTAVTSLSDCISVEHLGVLLRNLSVKNGRRFTPTRAFPKEFEEGKANLVICPENDTFTTLLSIYLHSPNEPLPSLSEVLLCSEKTTKDDIELFLRRAVALDAETVTRLYCLASAEKLSFDVSNATERMIKQFERESERNLKYRLVILCASNQHYMASLLYENRVDYVNRFPSEQLQDYIASQIPLHGDLKAYLNSKDQFNVKTSSVVVTSEKAGLGKSLHIQRCRDRLPDDCRFLTIRFLNKNLDEDEIMNQLLPDKENTHNSMCHFVHFDITPSVQFGVANFLFNLLILGGFTDAYGTLWRRYEKHCYVLEYTNPFLRKEQTKKKITLEGLFFNLLPTLRCLSPLEIVNLNPENPPENSLLMDAQEFRSEVFQRSFQYLQRYHRNINLDTFIYEHAAGTPLECIKTLLAHCSLQDPTWSELYHFASFLNSQLSDCEKSVFCDPNLVGADSGLSGFKNFVVRFMIRMSQDFATPSLVAGSDSPGASEDIFESHQLRRRWEEDAHPYLFFNEDHASLTFFNFFVNSQGGLFDPKIQTRVLEPGLIPVTLLQGLKVQNVKLNQVFDNLPRMQKLVTLCRIMGLFEELFEDPDPSYELTTDNVLKILAIHMRFRCGIPVVVMGETGCGKTRMVEFMSRLIKGSRVQKIEAERRRQGPSSGEMNANVSQEDIQNIEIVKVHGGITVPMIQQKLRQAADLAIANKTKHGLNTMLFLDEANTTEAIYAIKEYVCDKTINGEPVQAPGLQIICACNPYRKHSPEAVKKMAEAGLGFRVKTEDTTDKLGEIPMRCLVYRVIALPPSMQPLVWDFGQLSEQAERIYIQQMVAKLRLQMFSEHEKQLIVRVLSASQEFMRKQRSQCLFVSLRDVERCLSSFQWFFKNRAWLYDLIVKNLVADNGGIRFPNCAVSVALRTLIQAVGMCYHVTLEERLPYIECLSQCFGEFGYSITPENIIQEINACQSVFSLNLNLDDNIACNEALRENSYMIAMCTEMRIPLFLIGKPGSSKSLAKTVVTDAMQGASSRSEVFQRLKQIHVLSFQCSAVSDAVGIEAVFTQCSQVQSNQDPDKFVSVVVLDEVGLAEDSPKMPLKVLHPLLEGASIHADNDSSKTDKNVASQCRVGFVGISNWALDPAKMNRGIFVIRGDPTDKDLQLTANGIFSSDSKEFKEVDRLVELLTNSYLDIRKQQEQEFFGLRDYYGLLKMIFSIVKNGNVDLDNYHIADAIKRNFSGGKMNCFEVFLPHLQSVWANARESKKSLRTLIKENLQSVEDCESRFLLLLTNRFAAVTLLDRIVDSRDFQVIFGSSFPQDNDYTELCRNINRIKICMESGCTVVLLNLRDLYESLYDALNQHYVTFAGQRYVDLGLGGHRVKCRISEKFRLIVIEDKNVVYDEFPIPLINRLEKYIFTSESVLNDDEKQNASRIDEWIERFSFLDISLHEQRSIKKFTVTQCFPGFSEDSGASAVLQAYEAPNEDLQSYSKAQEILLSTATVDSVFRLQRSKLKKEAEKFQQLYLRHQSHDSLALFLKELLLHRDEISLSDMKTFVYEITSFSQILGEHDRQKMETVLGLSKNSIMLLTLQQFQTQADYNAKLESFFKFTVEKSELSTEENLTYVLFIQCPQAPKHGNLIACARYSLKNILKNQLGFLKESNTVCIVVAFLYTMDRQSGGIETSFSFNSSDFSSLFIDELRPSVDYMGPPSRFWNQDFGKIFEESLKDFPADTPCKLSNSNYLLDPFKLVQSCIPAAMVRVTSLCDGTDRNRVFLLHRLFHDQHIVVCEPFKRFMFYHIANLLKARDEKISGNKWHWSVQEACLQESLYEGGTFSKALWLYLKKIVHLCIAEIVSVIDEDNNLDILFRKNNLILDFWLETFKNKYLCSFTTNQILKKAKEFGVRGKNGFSCQFPFSRRISEWFGRHWDFVQSLQLDHKVEKFFEVVNETNFGSNLQKTFADKPILEPINYFLCDLICMHYDVPSSNCLETTLLQKSLSLMFEASFQSCSDRRRLGNHIAVSYSLFAGSRQEVLQMLSIFKVLPCLLTEDSVEKWISQQKSSARFLLHCSVYHDALDYLKNSLNTISHAQEYLDWKNTAKKILDLKVDLSFCAKSSDMIREKGAIAFVDLFLSVLIPENLSTKDLDNYLGILVPLTKRLRTGAVITSLTHPKFLNIVMGILRNCSQDLHLKLILSWNDISCKRCKKQKISKPVILPCKHYFCHDCIRIARLQECPTCRSKFPDGFTLEDAQLPPEDVEQYETFKRSCTSFFLQYLSTLCFPAAFEKPSTAGVNEAIWKTLEGLVIKEEKTRDLTPINLTDLDENPTIRSFILQLLLRYNRDNTESVLEEHFKKMEGVFGDVKELMMIIVRCIEDCLQVEGENAKKKGDQQFFDFVMGLIEKVEEKYLESAENESVVSELDLVAQLRYLIKITAKLINKLPLYDDYKQESCKDLLQTVCDMVNRNGFVAARNYFVKLLCRRYGFSDFQLLVEENEFLSLLPENLNPSHMNDSITLKSSLALLGKAYQESKTVLDFVKSQSDIENTLSDLSRRASASPDEAVQVLHAVSTWMNDSVREEIYNSRKEFFDTFTENLRADDKVSNKVLDFFTSFACNSKNLIVEDETLGCSRAVMHILHEFIAVVGSLLASSSHNILSELQNLINNPHLIQTRFLPTMPLAGYFEVKDTVKTWIENHRLPPKAYLCPNNHVYFIGNCTNPEGEGKCPDCNQPIGGLGVLKPGNKAGVLEESSQLGYLLAPPDVRSSMPTRERNCSRLVLCIIRMFLHASMLHACETGYEVAIHLKQTDQSSAKKLLLRHLHVDFNQLLDCLGKSAEDAALLLHQILKQARLKQDAIHSYSCSLTTMKGREAWEDEFSRIFLSPVLERADDIIDEARQICRSTETQNLLERIVYEIPIDTDPALEEVANLADDINLETEFLWSYQVNVNVSNLRQKLEGLSTNDNPAGSVLKLILNETDLSQVQYLPQIISLQNTLIQRFQREVDVTDIEKVTINSFIAEDGRPSLRPLFQIYIDVWNSVRKNLPNTLGLPEEALRREINMNSPVVMCLPSSTGSGRCALLLTQYLLEKQNNLLNKCRKTLPSLPSYPEISLNQLTPDDVICINDEQSLMPIILSNSQYEVVKTPTGTEHKIVYWIPALEKQVIQKFIVNKKLLDKKSLPQIKFLQDTTLGEECRKMKENVPQEPLPHKISQKLTDLCLKHRLTDICEGVRTIVLVIRYLSKLGSPGDKLLITYITEDIMMSPEEATMIPKSAQLCHTMALYERLSWQRSLLFVINGQDPFANLNLQEAEVTEDDDDDHVTDDEIEKSVEKMKVSCLQLEVNSMILLRPEFEPHGSLREYLEECIEEKSSDDNSDAKMMIKHIPANLKMKDAPRLFKISALCNA